MSTYTSWRDKSTVYTSEKQWLRDYSRQEMILVDKKGNVYILKGVRTFSKSKMIQIAVRKKGTPLPRILESFFFFFPCCSIWTSIICLISHYLSNISSNNMVLRLSMCVRFPEPLQIRLNPITFKDHFTYIFHYTFLWWIV